MTTSNSGGLDPSLAAPAGPTTPGVHQPPDHDEIVYYQGSPLVRGGLAKLFEFGFIGLVLIIVPIAAWVFKHTFPAIVNAIMVVVGLLMFLVPALRTKTIRYRITNYRIDYERGVLARNIDTLELWHVEDLHFHQSLLDLKQAYLPSL
jgi:hypothetical protein